ncbi:polysaccharide deacetylase family protein [Hufsiella ginkgonis]|uniref:Polysaccharide deacetylase family protein n=1 Tax=Hufsiella ginkgonis TaxID=2695274 RepID=A0A7K1Y1I5_9SPHI|nr:polysaccharide deacetylase family protein [Hufsiella ginkgonis]MXV17113.1 polysaccharide deacetylase family protein [Hufsiella ginkgonis]
MYLVKTPFLLRWWYPAFLWRRSRKEKVIYLTFDDGPIPVVTPFVLKTLRLFNAKATFFCIGDNIQKHPEVFAALKRDGHHVGNHTYNHLKGWDTEDTVYVNNAMRCDTLVSSSLFRPPYGRIRKSQSRKLAASYSDRHAGRKLEIVMWDVLSGDFDVNLLPSACLQNVLKHTENGSIVVFHDSLKAFDRLEYTLPRALEVWSEKGYTFGVL